MLRNNVVLTSSSLNLEVNPKRMSKFMFNDLEHSFHSNAKYLYWSVQINDRIKTLEKSYFFSVKVFSFMIIPTT